MRSTLFFPSSLILAVCAQPAWAGGEGCAAAAQSAASSSCTRAATQSCSAGAATAAAPAATGEGCQAVVAPAAPAAPAANGQGGCGTGCGAGAGQAAAPLARAASAPAGGGSPVAEGSLVLAAPARSLPAQAAPQSSDRGYLGVSIAIEADAITVQSVLPNSPAETAGLREGDRIVRVGGRSIGEIGDVSAMLQSNRVGETITVTVDRDGWTRDVEVTLSGADPAWGIASGRVEPAPAEAGEAPEMEEGVTRESEDGLEVFRMREEGEPLAKQDAHVRVLRTPGQGKHSVEVEVLRGGEPNVLHWEGNLEDLEELEGVEGVHVFGDAVVLGEDGEPLALGEGRVITKSIQIPGGECRIEVRVEGDGKGLRALRIGGDGEGAAAEGVIVLEDESEGSEGTTVRRRLALPDIASRVRKELGESGELRARRVDPQGEAATLREELAALRAEVAELRKLRDELQQLESLREELRALRDALGDRAR